MLVEDEKDLSQVIKLLLERLNDKFRITIFDTPKTALSSLKTEQFNIIISDYNMPDCNGITFLTEIRKNNISIPFIVFTGYDQQELESEAINAGATYFVKKGNDIKNSINELNKFMSFIFRQQKRATKLGFSEGTNRIISEFTPNFDKKIHLEQIIQNIEIGIYILNLFGEVVFTNKKGALDLGYPTVDALLADKSNKDIFKILDIYNPKYFDFLSKRFSFNNEDDLFSDELINLSSHTNDINDKWILKKITPIFSKDFNLQFVSITTYDMSNLMKNEYESNRELQHGLLLNNCLDLIYHAADEKDFLDSFCKLLVEKSNYILVWIGSAEIHHDQKIVLPISAYGFETDYLDNIKITWDDSPSGLGPVGTAIKTKKPAVFNDISNDKDFTPWREPALKRGYQSCLALPLRLNNDCAVYGSLNIYSSRKNAFLEKDINVLTNLTHILTAGLQILKTGTNLYLDENFNEFPIALIEANVDEVFKLSNEIRSNYLGDLRHYVEKYPESINNVIKKLQITKINEKAYDLFKTPKNSLNLDLSKLMTVNSTKTFQEIFIALNEGKKELIKKIRLSNYVNKEFDALIKFVLSPKSDKKLLIAIITI
jgi:CheY-like chemotaxis protein